MTLVDSSVWIDHFRHGNQRLATLLEESEVLGHADVTGELACGWLNRRAEILTLLQRLPSTAPEEPDDILEFIEEHRLWGRGLGWTDVRLLSSAARACARLWTLDRALASAARELGLV